MADLKASLCGELPNQESVIPKEQLRNLLERRGIVGDPDIPNAKARLAEQELRRNMYHNTQVMLKHYRDIVWALECFPSEVAQELDQPLKDLDALLSVVDTQVALGNAKLEHRLLSIRKSQLLLDRINEALTVLRHKPGNGELMYNIIFQTFITPDKPNHSDILYRLDISERHYYGSSTQPVTATRTYPNLANQDLNHLPKSITEGGRTLTLQDVQWQTDNTYNADDYEIGDRFTAVCTYGGSKTVSYVTGYTRTARGLYVASAAA